MSVRLLTGDCRAMLATLPASSVHCVVTSPPYYALRSYGTEPQIWGGDSECPHEWQTERRYVEGGGNQRSSEAFHAPGVMNAARLKQTRWKQDDTCQRCGAWRGELGQEPTLADFIAHLVEVFREVRRVLRPDGVCFVNMGDSYAGGGYGNHRINGDAWKAAAGLDRRRDRQQALKAANAADGFKAKDLMMAPARLAIALQADGWWLRSDIIWHKPNPMPESVTDRPSSAHEHVFMFTKSARYFYDAAAVRTEAKAPTTKMPDGWDTGPGAHGSFHRNGREKGSRTDKQRGHDRRHDGFNDRWDALPKDEQMAMGANLRNVWTIATHPFALAHFATFPPEIPRRCILAGTSEKGCCPACGAPWVRVVESESHVGAARGTQPSQFRANLQGPQQSSVTVTTRTVGWQPSCACWSAESSPAAPIPCTVMDIFGGSGTVGVVADRLGRDAILIDLKPEYVGMAKDRITGDAPLFASVEVA